jgi:uncharacterized protein (TIGR02246 family)
MNADERRIRDLIAQWHRATAAGNVDAVLRLMSKDAVFLLPGKPPVQGRDQFEKGLRALLQAHRIESSGKVEEIRVADDLAYSWTSLTVRVTPLAGGDAVERAGSALSIFRKQADGISWLLVRDANLLPPA